MTTDLAKPEKEITEEQITELLRYENIRTLIDNYKVFDWSPELEIQYLIEIIRDTNDNAVRLRVLKEIRTRRMEVIKNSGLIVSASKTHESPDGTKTVFSTNLVATALGNPIPLRKEIKSEQTDARQEEPAKPKSKGKRPAKKVAGPKKKKPADSGLDPGTPNTSSRTTNDSGARDDSPSRGIDGPNRGDGVGDPRSSEPTGTIGNGPDIPTTSYRPPTGKVIFKGLAKGAKGTPGTI